MSCSFGWVARPGVLDVVVLSWASPRLNLVYLLWAVQTVERPFPPEWIRTNSCAVSIVERPTGRRVVGELRGNTAALCAGGRSARS